MNNAGRHFCLKLGLVLEGTNSASPTRISSARRRSEVSRSTCWSVRDPKRALALALGVVAKAPTRDRPWLTLALAQYRMEDWAAASAALQKSIQLTPNRAGAARHWLLGAMICFQQGRVDEARERHTQAVEWIDKYHPSDDDTLSLAAEAAELRE